MTAYAHAPTPGVGMTGGCALCGGAPCVVVTETRVLTYGGRRVVVPETFHRCAVCEEEYLSPAQWDALQAALERALTGAA